jgi:MFS family permease
MRRLPIASLLTTNLISNLGNAMTSLAVPWFVLETTGSASRTGLTAAVALVPMVVMSFFGGALVDRTSRRGLSIFADAMSAVFLAAIPLLHMAGWLSFPMLLAMMFMGAIFDSPGATARQAMVPELSTKGDVSLERVNSLFGVNQAISTLAGAPLAGLMIAWLGPVHVLWFATGAFVVSILGMALFVPPLPKAAPSGENFIEDVKIGLRYVWGNGLLRTVIVASLAVNMVISPVFGVSIPVLAKTQFGNASDLGWLMSGLGAGLLAGSILYGMIGDRISKQKQVLIAVAAIGLPLFAVSATSSLFVIMGLLCVMGVGSGVTNPLIATVLQSRTPSDVLGRVFGTLSAGAMLATPLGMLLGGLVISRFGIEASFLICGGTIIAVLVFCLLSPSLRELDAPPLDHAPCVSPKQDAELAA